MTQTYPVYNQYIGKHVEPVHNFLWYVSFGLVWFLISFFLFLKVWIKVCLLIFPKHCVGNVHHENFQFSSEGELELVGLMRPRKPLFLWPALCNHGSRELCGKGVEEHLTHFVCVNGRCILFIDAGTRVHLLDAKGLSFTHNVFICICYSLQYIWILGQHIKIQWPVMSWKYLVLPLSGILHSVGQLEQPLCR